MSSSGRGTSPAAPDHNAKRSTSLDAIASRFSFVTGVSDPTTVSASFELLVSAVPGPVDFVAICDPLALAVHRARQTIGWSASLTLEPVQPGSADVSEH